MYFLLLNGISSAPQMDLDNYEVVKKAAGLVTARAMSYYKPGTPAARLGHIIENPVETRQGYQWYEAGIMWCAVLEYARQTGDNQYSQAVTEGLGMASYGQIGSFLGSDKAINGLAGRWNDDISWWGMATTTGAELFGKDSKIPGGVTYFQLAQSTYDDVWSQWDDKCGGGIYWNRNRADDNLAKRYYKSSISNSQNMNMGARLYLLTKNQTFLDNSLKLYKWMKDHVVTKDFGVVDGVQADQSCKASSMELSYNAGTFAGALAWLYKASGQEEIMQLADKVALAAAKKFSDGNNVFKDVSCEPKCLLPVVSPKGAMLQGLIHVLMFTKSQQVKDTLKLSLQTTIKKILPVCDDQLNCPIDNWSLGKQDDENNVHFQTNAMELFNAMTAYFGNYVGKLDTPTGNGNNKPGSASSAGLWTVFSLAMVFFFMSQ